MGKGLGIDYKFRVLSDERIESMAIMFDYEEELKTMLDMDINEPSNMLDFLIPYSVLSEAFAVENKIEFEEYLAEVDQNMDPQIDKYQFLATEISVLRDSNIQACINELEEELGEKVEYTGEFVSFYIDEEGVAFTDNGDVKLVFTNKEFMEDDDK